MLSENILLCKILSKIFDLGTPVLLIKNGFVDLNALSTSRKEYKLFTKLFSSYLKSSNKNIFYIFKIVDIRFYCFIIKTAFYNMKSPPYIIIYPLAFSFNGFLES